MKSCVHKKRIELCTFIYLVRGLYVHAKRTWLHFAMMIHVLKGLGLPKITYLLL